MPVVGTTRRRIVKRLLERRNEKPEYSVDDGTAAYDTPDQGDGDRLWNLSPRIQPADNRYSRIYRGKTELIDHILASHLVSHHVGDGDLTAGGVPNSIDDNPNSRRNSPASDHRPLIAAIDL